MAITPNTTFTAGAVLTAAQMNRLPWGIMETASVTSSQTGISALTDITSLTVTFTADSTRYYRTTIWSLVRQNTAAGTPVIQITDGSNAQKTEGDFYIGAAGNFGTLCVQCIETGLTGSTTRKGRAVTASNTMDVIASSTFPAFILVEDLGQA
jgi:hypothetical protein